MMDFNMSDMAAVIQTIVKHKGIKVILRNKDSFNLISSSSNLLIGVMEYNSRTKAWKIPLLGGCILELSEYKDIVKFSEMLDTYISWRVSYPDEKNLTQKMGWC